LVLLLTAANVLAEIWATRALLHPAACPMVLHIKGHQDKKTAYELLAFPAQLNVDADKLGTTLQPTSTKTMQW